MLPVCRPLWVVAAVVSAGPASAAVVDITFFGHVTDVFDRPGLAPAVAGVGIGDGFEFTISMDVSAAPQDASDPNGTGVFVTGIIGTRLRIGASGPADCGPAHTEKLELWNDYEENGAPHSDVIRNWGNPPLGVGAGYFSDDSAYAEAQVATNTFASSFVIPYGFDVPAIGYLSYYAETLRDPITGDRYDGSIFGEVTRVRALLVPGPGAATIVLGGVLITRRRRQARRSPRCLPAGAPPRSGW